jgi:hypothetical protein
VTLAIAFLASGLYGCRTHSPSARTSAHEPGPIRFREVTHEAGIRFQLGHGGQHPLPILDTVGCGGGFLDYDRDGNPDLLLVGQPTRAPEPACALYRNRGDSTFVDVTREAGLDRSALWMGCAVGDYDNDGYPDLLLTGYGALALLHNEGRPTTNDQRPTRQGVGSREPGARSRFFRDVTRAMGLRAGATDWFTSAGWADVDRDGFLDLYVARYVQFDDRAPKMCSLGLDSQGQKVPGTCGPELYGTQRGVFYRNLGGRRFAEETTRYGLDVVHGKGLGVAFGDYDDDGWPDLYVANDRMPGDLMRNVPARPGATGARRFVPVGAEQGVAYAGDSRPQAGMGVDWGDYNRDGRLDLIVTTFFLERKSLYRNEGPLGFQEVSDEAGLTPAIPFVGWGARWLDADNDGHLDCVLANGHAVDNMEKVDPAQPYAQRTQLFRSEGELLREIGAQAGPAFSRAIAGRGVATGDWDNDGRVDLLITNAEGEPLLLRNESATPNHWLRITLVGNAGPDQRPTTNDQQGNRQGGRWSLVVGRHSNRDAIGARVWVTAAGVTQMREVTTGGSYLSASDPRLLFGLGSATRVERVRIRWPAGSMTERTDVAADRELAVREDSARQSPRMAAKDSGSLSFAAIHGD